jgi:hypothetical protein
MFMPVGLLGMETVAVELDDRAPEVPVCVELLVPAMVEVVELEELSLSAWATPEGSRLLAPLT